MGSSLSGLWHRLILSQPGKTVDTLTQVDWLQGPELYADLRQPTGPASTVQASCLADLTLAEALELARQEGFAGHFILSDGVGTWLRSIDFQPLGPLGDVGRLESHGDLLIEYGVEADYIEHWQRQPGSSDAPCWAARFTSEDDGRDVIMVRCGPNFAFARDRGVALEPGENLTQRMEQASEAEARCLIDCEIALGSISADGWRIERSTLPWRRGTILLPPRAALAGDRLVVAETDSLGRPTVRRLLMREAQGTPDFRAAGCSAASEPKSDLASGPFQSVPIVDVSALGGADSAAEARAVEALRRAAAQTGFFHIVGHGIAPAVTERLQATAKAFFNQPLAVKRASYIGNSSNHRGYVPEGEEVLMAGTRDKKEAFDLAFDLPATAVPAGHPMLGPNQWPDLPGFREDVMAYYAAVFGVGRRLLRGFALALGKPADSFDHLIQSPPSQLRLIHYPYQPDAADAPGIGAHTDYECFTLLLATGPGLEVMNQAGEWIDAPPVAGGLVVNIGDMMEFWSAGAFVATSHRVRKVAQERWSFPLFFALDYDVELRPLGSTADQPAIRTGEHLYAQTCQTFTYLQQRARRGEIALPPAALPLSSFGQEARHRQKNPA